MFNMLWSEKMVVNTEQNPDKVKTKVSKEELDKISQLISEIEFGSVSIVIQNGQILQIEKNEKIRLK
jgi:hypothetical protein